MYVRAPKSSASLSKNTSLSASPPCANTSTPSASAAVYEAVPADGVCLFQTVPHLKRAFRARSTGRLGWTFLEGDSRDGPEAKALSGAVVQEPSGHARLTHKQKSRYNCRECL